MKKIVPIVIGVLLAVAGIVLALRRKAAASAPDRVMPAQTQPIPSPASLPVSDSDASGIDGDKDKKRTANLKKLIMTVITILKTVLAVIDAKERSV